MLDWTPAARGTRTRSIRRSEGIRSLPLYGELGIDDVDRIADALLALPSHADAIRAALGGRPG